MITTWILPLVAGALYSGAYMWPKPWCYVALGISATLVLLMRMK